MASLYWGANRLTWEKAIKYDIGIDLSLWNGLFTLTADIYKDRRGRHLPATWQHPYTVGVEQMKPWANIGVMESKGVDGNFAVYKESWRCRRNTPCKYDICYQRSDRP